MSRQTKLVNDEEIQIRRAIPLEEAQVIANNLIALYNTLDYTMEVVGAVRRQRSTVNDIDFIVVATDQYWEGVKRDVIEALNGRKVLSGPKIFRFILPFERGNVQVDIYRATKNNYGIVKLFRTGSEEHNIWLATYAIKKMMRLLCSQGLTKDGKVIAGKTEEELFETLGLPYISPSLREIVNGKPMWLK